MRCVICGYPLLHKNLPSACSHPGVQHINDVVRGARVHVEASKEVAEAPVAEAQPAPTVIAEPEPKEERVAEAPKPPKAGK